MIEVAITIILLAHGIIYESGASFIAAGLFAVATNIGNLKR